MQFRKQHLIKLAKTPFGVPAILLVLLLNLLAASPSLHERFHADAGNSEHQCAVTLFAHGQVDSATIDVPVSPSLTFVAVVPSVELSVFRPAIENLPAGRAPPVSSANS